MRKVQAILRPGTGGRLCSPNLRFGRPALSIELHPYIYRPQRRYAPGWVRLSGGLFVVLTKALRPRLHRRCFVLPGRLLLFTACFAASRARPSGSDVWADALVRHVWSAPELHRGGGCLVRAYSRVALCLSLDGSVCPRPGEEVNTQAGERKKGGDARYSCRLWSGRRIMRR